MTSFMPASQRVVTLGCMHAVGGVDEAQAVLPLPCAGHLDVATLLWAFIKGADGVLVLACRGFECRHWHGPGDHGTGASGASAVSVARRLIEKAGLSSKRIAHRIVEPDTDVAALVGSFEADIDALGALQRRALPEPSESAEPFSADRCARLLAYLQASHDLRGPAAGGAKGGDLLWLGCGEARCLATGEAPSGPDAALELFRACAKDGTGAVEQAQCCGQSLIAAGETEAFALLARTNARLIADSGARRVVTACPHCAVTMGEHYGAAEAGLKVPVLSLAELALESLEPGRAAPSSALLTHTGSPEALSTRFFADSTTTTVAWGPGGPEPVPVGPQLREAVEKLNSDARRRGAESLVVTSPHVAALLRSAQGRGGWRIGAALTIVDVAGALLQQASTTQERSEQ